jgi:uncharacterized protein (TIGR03083 family)
MGAGLDTMALARQEREQFAGLLAGLAAEEWDAPTLCERWRVRDVVAHVIGYDELSRAGLVWRFVKGWLVVNKINQAEVAEYAGRTPDQLLALVRAHVEPAGLTAGFGGLIALTDGMVHQQDIRRALGRPRAIPPDRLRVALDFARTAPLIRGAWRARGVRLVAHDSELGAVERRARNSISIVEEEVGVQVVITQEFECVAMEIAASGFRHHVVNIPGAPAVLSREAVGLDLGFLDRIH